MIEECPQILGIYVGGVKGVMWPHLCRRFISQSLIWFKSIRKFVLGGIRIGMGYMNLVTVIRIYMCVGTHNLNLLS